ncbi:MAG: lysophospholipid acyltransferase family protein [Acidimicrobiia bacterium]
MDEPSTRAFRFVAEGGRANQARARLAGPLIVGSSWLISVAACTGSRSLVHRLERTFGRLAETVAGLRIEIHGIHHVDPKEQYVVVPLHEGLADAIALLRLPLGLRFAARDEMFEWPGLGRYLHATRHPMVDTAPSVGSVRRFLRQASSVFDDRDNLVIFAQGSILGLDVAFQPGAVRLARRFGRPILPVVLTGSHRVWEQPHSPRLRFGQRVSMRVLEPIAPAEINTSRFRRLEREMKRIALDGDIASPRRFEPDRDGWWDGYRFEIDPDFPELKDRVATHRRELCKE